VVQGAGAWCNKMWQLARFLNMAHQRANQDSSVPPDYSPGIVDLWILNQLANTVQNVNEHFKNHDLHLLTRQLRSFLYHDVCDVYVEYVKQVLGNPDHREFHSSLLFLHTCVVTSLKMIHPVMPFITEEIFQRLPKMANERRKDSIMIEKYPQPEDWAKFRNNDLTNMMSIILDVVSGIRGLKKHYELAKESDPMVVIYCKSDVYGNEQLAEFEEAVSRLTKCSEINFSSEPLDVSSLPLGFIQSTVEDITIYMDIGKHVDVDKELKKISQKLAKNQKEIEKVEKSRKGSFKYRLSEDEIARKREELGIVKERLEVQLNHMEQLRKLR